MEGKGSDNHRGEKRGGTPTYSSWVKRKITPKKKGGLRTVSLDNM